KPPEGQSTIFKVPELILARTGGAEQYDLSFHRLRLRPIDRSLQGLAAGEGHLPLQRCLDLRRVLSDGEDLTYPARAELHHVLVGASLAPPPEDEPHALLEGGKGHHGRSHVGRLGVVDVLDAIQGPD